MIEIRTGVDAFDGLWPIVDGFLRADVREIPYEGRMVRGYRSPDCPYIWFRDHIHMMEASVYMEEDIKNAVEFMLDMQQPDGHFYDYISPEGEMLRVPTEADVEYLAVIGVYRAWQATGDDEWMRGCLPRLERGLEYCTSHPWRWDFEHRMIKRAYTIDTWDFDYREDLQEIHWPGKIDDKTHFGIMHGDNSGLYYAFRLMAVMYGHLGMETETEDYFEKAAEFQERVNKLLFNGRFYRHRYPLDDVRIPGVDEDEQLSLSNAYNLNRGLPTPEMGQAIIEEYRRRHESGKAFAEWYSIDPPFPKGVFGADKLVPGSYVNGGIMPLVGGELARGAFRFGYSDYGVDILKRYYKMVESSGESYLWYFPNGTHATEETSTSPEALPTDGWGSSAMAAALIEGLAGVQDMGCLFREVHLSPKWLAAGVDEAEVDISYAASGAEFGYTYKHDADKRSIRFDFHAGLPRALSLLLPVGVQKARVDWGRERIRIDVIPQRDGVLAHVALNKVDASSVSVHYDYD